MKSFQQKVREGREALSLNRTEFAKMLGVTRMTVINFEELDRKPRPASVRKLAEVLNVSIDYLLHDEIEDPTYGLEKQPYVEEARELYGSKAAREVDFLMERNAALFAGGELSQEAKDAYFEAVMAAYLECKQAAKEKFGHKKSK